MRNIFLSLIAFSMVTFLSSCDSQNTGEANNTSDTANTEAQIEVGQSAGEVAEEEVAAPEDMIYHAFMNSMMQTTLGQMAEQKAASEQVQSLGTEIVEQNKQLMAKIEDLAKAAEMPVPQGLKVEHQQKLDSITQLSGQEFDQAFVNLLLEQQQESIDLLQELSANADNAIIRGLASDIVETERGQIERAEIVKEEMM